MNKTRLRISDRYFDLVLVPDKSRDHLSNSSAASSEWYQKIHISVNDRKPDGIVSDLWHEIVEMINSISNLQLNHQTITALGVSIHQVLRDNAKILSKISREGG